MPIYIVDAGRQEKSIIQKKSSESYWVVEVKFVAFLKKTFHI